MRRFLALAAVLMLALTASATAASAADGPLTRAWEAPVSIGGDDLVDRDAGLAPGGRVVSVQQRGSTSDSARIGVTETDGRTGVAVDTALWLDRSRGYYPRLATSPDGAVATAFSDGQQLHVHVKRPGGSWHEVGSVHEGQTDYSDGRPLLAFTVLGHLVVTWPRKDPGGGQRLWLTELAPGADELAPPRPLDPPAQPAVVQVARDLAVSADGRIALAYLQGPSRTHDLTARVAFGRLGADLGERHALPGIVTPWSWRAPRVGFDLAGGAAIACTRFPTASSRAPHSATYTSSYGAPTGRSAPPSTSARPRRPARWTWPCRTSARCCSATRSPATCPAGAGAGATRAAAFTASSARPCLDGSVSRRSSYRGQATAAAWR